MPVEWSAAHPPPPGTQAVLKRFYNHVALPLLSSLPSSSSASPPSFSTFLHAYVLVSSRAFQVSSYHPLALVPLADAFNHSDPPHAHLASDTWVCPECGRLGACPHDDDGGGPGHEERDEPLETVDMVSERKINPGEEVFNTYGAGLSNAHLVAAYGFLLEGNEHDVVSFGGREALQTMLRASDSAAVGDVDLDALEHALDSLGAAWRAAAASAPLLDEGHPLIAPLPSSPTPNLLGCFIDADARLSPELWLAVSLVAWLTARDDEAQRPAKRARSAAPPAVVVDASEALQDAVQLAELAEEAWRRCEEEAAADADGLGDADAGARDVAWPADEFEREALRCASALVRSVCAARIEEQVEEARGMDASALYERAEVRCVLSPPLCAHWAENGSPADTSVRLRTSAGDGRSLPPARHRVPCGRATLVRPRVVAVDILLMPHYRLKVRRSGKALDAVRLPQTVLVSRAGDGRSDALECTGLIYGESTVSGCRV